MLEQYWSHISGEVFEERCAKLFRLLGFMVTMTRKGPDDGIDFVAMLKQIRTAQIIVQCKDRPRSKVGVKPVRELYGVMRITHAQMGILIATSTFTRPAIAFTQKTPVYLLDGYNLSLAEDDSTQRQRLRCNIFSACLSGIALKGANLRGINLRGVNLADANLSKSILCKANLRNTSLREANLTEADLRHADLRGAYFNFTNLEKADLRNANLGNVDFAYNEAKNEWSAFLGGAKYNRYTVWPNGFDPVVLGAVYQE